mmetsp:Transcript_8434/g.20741  ORF Transcript_8434/g.20741 Transcript_8434/m.20741 type:complete len:257 (-) Transcript_8434:62-832(-)
MVRRLSRTIHSEIGKVGSTREGFVLFVVQERLLPSIVLQSFQVAEICVQVCICRSGIAFYQIGVVDVQIFGIFFHYPEVNLDGRFVRIRQKESMRGKGAGSPRRERIIMPHQVCRPAFGRLPVEIKMLVGHIDEFPCQTIKGRLHPFVLLLGRASIRIPVEIVQLRFDIDHGSFWTITNVISEFFQCRIFSLVTSRRSPVTGWLFGSNRQQRCCQQSRQKKKSPGKLHHHHFAVLCFLQARSKRLRKSCVWCKENI